MQDEARVARVMECIGKLLRYSEGADYESFSADSMLAEACVFNLSRIGELCHSMSDDLVAAHPEIPWNEIYGLRNRIVHNYEGVNLRLVWEIISGDVPELYTKMKKLQDEMPGERSD